MWNTAFVSFIRSRHNDKVILVPYINKIVFSQNGTNQTEVLTNDS